MWNINSIRGKNISSHTDSEYVFKQDETFLIYGINEDTEKERSNGSGKSGLVEMINIGFVGEPLRKINKGSIIKRGEKSGEVILELVNSLLNLHVMIYWKLFSNTSPTECNIVINGQEQKQLTTINEKKQFVFDLLDINKEDFHNYFLISKGNYKNFFSCGDVAKKEIINRFSKADILNPVDLKISSEVKKLEEEIKVVESNGIRLSTLVSVYQDEIEKLMEFDIEKERSKIGEEYRNEIDSCKLNLQQNELSLVSTKDKLELEKKKLEESESVIVDYKQRKTKFTEKIEEVTKELQIKREKYNSLSETLFRVERIEIKKELDNIEVEIKRVRDELNEVETFISEHKNILHGVIECPKCSHEFILGDLQTDIEQVREELEELDSIKEETILLIESLKTHTQLLLEKEIDFKKLIREEEKLVELEGKSIKLNLGELEGTLQLITNGVSNESLAKTHIEIEIERVQAKIKSVEEENSTLEKKKLQYTILLENLANKDMELNIPLKKKNLKEKKLQLKENNFKLEILKLRKSEKEEWSINFKKFRSYLANQSITTINGYTNYYLEKMKSELQVNIEGYKLLADKKTIRESINTGVLRDGCLEGDYNAFSGGERITMDMALILTFQKMINSNSKGGGLNFLCTDEIIESLDSVGVELVVNALSNIEETTLHVTHSPLNYEYKNKIVIHKKNGSSYLVIQ